MSKLISALVVIFLLLASSSLAIAQDSAAEAAEAAAEAQRAADFAALAGTAEGLYRGCKTAQEWRRSERPSDSDLSLALELMNDCENFVAGAAAVTFSEVKFLSTCSTKKILDPDAIIDEIVSVVKRDPLKIGSGQRREWLLRLAMFNLAGCK